MGSFFNLDGPVNKFGTLIADMLILSFLWFLFSIPLITIGASTTALYYVTTRRISNKEGYIFKDFFKSFKLNFKQSTLIWLIILVIGVIIFINITKVNSLNLPYILKVFFLPIQYALFIELLLTTMYIFPIISRFDMGFKELIKSSFFMANKHLLTSLLCIATVGLILTALYYQPILIVFSMSVYAFATSYFLMRVFKKYRPEIDEDEIYAE